MNKMRKSLFMDSNLWIQDEHSSFNVESNEMSNLDVLAELKKEINVDSILTSMNEANILDNAFMSAIETLNDDHVPIINDDDMNMNDDSINNNSNNNNYNSDEDVLDLQMATLNGNSNDDISVFDHINSDNCSIMTHFGDSAAPVIHLDNTSQNNNVIMTPLTYIVNAFNNSYTDIINKQVNTFPAYQRDMNKKPNNYRPNSMPPLHIPLFNSQINIENISPNDSSTFATHSLISDINTHIPANNNDIQLSDTIPRFKNNSYQPNIIKNKKPDKPKSVTCQCFRTMIQVKIGDEYDDDITIYCDNCDAMVNHSEKAYHCPYKSRIHKHGYHICLDCINNNKYTRKRILYYGNSNNNKPKRKKHKKNNKIIVDADVELPRGIHNSSNECNNITNVMDITHNDDNNSINATFLSTPKSNTSLCELTPPTQIKISNPSPNLEPINESQLSLNPSDIILDINDMDNMDMDNIHVNKSKLSNMKEMTRMAGNILSKQESNKFSLFYNEMNTDYNVSVSQAFLSLLTQITSQNLNVNLIQNNTNFSDFDIQYQ